MILLAGQLCLGEGLHAGDPEGGVRHHIVSQRHQVDPSELGRCGHEALLQAHLQGTAPRRETHPGTSGVALVPEEEENDGR